LGGGKSSENTYGPETVGARPVKKREAKCKLSKEDQEEHQVGFFSLLLGKTAQGVDLEWMNLRRVEGRGWDRVTRKYEDPDSWWCTSETEQKTR